MTRAFSMTLISLRPSLHTILCAITMSNTLRSNETEPKSPDSPAGDYTDSVAWGAQTEISASEIVEKQRLVKYVCT